ncbi:MAG: ComF family protein [Limnochordia bacterium]|nr:ComF family protein [Bacillota bacterium]HOB09002.1 ComF family protein [Limnochordia bacterium]NLH31775.1 ComF family protein [Bacillota bacterium]HPT92992.1 ComF family protein [Limnochordia bacterium]HPZ31160.1 ComF family protein [Limnochordia bacterium]
MFKNPWLKSLWELMYPAPEFCPFCHTGIVPEGLPACGACTARISPSMHRLSLARYQGFAVGVYDDYLQYLLHQIKYLNQYQPAVALGKIMALAAREQPELGSVDYFLPVPLHHQRLQQRGFNQADALAAGMNQVWPHRVCSAVRIKPTEFQSGLSPSERVKNLRRAFMLTNPAAVRGKRVLIIDDIFTTGATFYSLADLVHSHRGEPLGLFLTYRRS